MKSALVFVVAMMVSTSAFALTIPEKKQMDAWNQYLSPTGDGKAKVVKTNCGVDIPVTLDPAMTTPFMAANASAATFCDDTRGVMADMCKDADYKTAIVKDVTKVSCKLGTAKQADLSMSGTTLVLTIGVDAANVSDAIKTYLQKNLK